MIMMTLMKMMTLMMLKMTKMMMTMEMTIMTQVYFPDGTNEAFEVESSTRSKDFCLEVLLLRMMIPNNNKNNKTNI